MVAVECLESLELFGAEGVDVFHFGYKLRGARGNWKRRIPATLLMSADAMTLSFYEQTKSAVWLTGWFEHNIPKRLRCIVKALVKTFYLATDKTTFGHGKSLERE